MKPTEKNKLLADFLVENEGGLIKLRENIYSTLDEFGMPDDDLILSDLKFDTSWNWLMQVVEKIEVLGYDLFIETFEVRIEKYRETLFRQHTKVSNRTKIKAVYNACVEFVKWHNTKEL